MAIRAFISSVNGSFAETPNAEASYQDATIAAAEALTGAVTTQIAAAQAIGAGDASAEIDLADTAFIACAAALSVIAASNQVTTDLAAAQAIGAGDASSEVDTLDTNFVAFEVVLAALEAGSSGAGNMTILINDTTLTTKTQIRARINEFLAQIENSNTFAE